MTAPACRVCGQALTDCCDVCDVALREGRSVEEVRLEIEDAARFWSHHLGSAEGRPCTCGAGSGGAPVAGPKGQLVGWIDFDVRHEPGCPRAPRPFDWPPVDEAERRRVFGYDGRELHARRLVAGLRAVLRDRLDDEEVA